MIAPSISFDTNQEPPIWRHLTLDGVKELLVNDVAELNHHLSLQAADEAAGVLNYTHRLLIASWERTQDVHWSWLKEIQSAGITAAAEGFEALGPAVVDTGN